jgi:hypothetical protein
MAFVFAGFEAGPVGTDEFQAPLLQNGLESGSTGLKLA